MATWPLVEVIHAYQHRMREAAHRAYLHRCLVWASTVKLRKDKKPPELPAILKDE